MNPLVVRTGQPSVQVEAHPLFRDVGCWSDYRRCCKRDQNRGRAKQQEEYPCQRMVDHLVSSDDCLLATTCML